MNNKEILKKSYDRIKYNIDENGCWNVTSGANYSGYTGYWNSSIGKYHSIGCHRLSYIINIGEIKKGKFICHHCDNRQCINPNHLYEGSAKDNAQDMVDRNRVNRDNCWKRKLTDDQIKDIYKSAESQYKLAIKYNISQTHIRRIKDGQEHSNITRHSILDTILKNKFKKIKKFHKEMRENKNKQNIILLKLFGYSRFQMLKYSNKMLKAGKWTNDDSLNYFKTGRTIEQEAKQKAKLKYPELRGLSNSERSKLQWQQPGMRDRICKSMKRKAGSCRGRNLKYDNYLMQCIYKAGLSTCDIGNARRFVISFGRLEHRTVNGMYEAFKKFKYHFENLNIEIDVNMLIEDFNKRKQKTA